MAVGRADRSTLDASSDPPLNRVPMASSNNRVHSVSVAWERVAPALALPIH